MVLLCANTICFGIFVVDNETSNHLREENQTTGTKGTSFPAPELALLILRTGTVVVIGPPGEANNFVYGKRLMSEKKNRFQEWFIVSFFSRSRASLRHMFSRRNFADLSHAQFDAHNHETSCMLIFAGKYRNIHYRSRHSYQRRLSRHRIAWRKCFSYRFYYNWKRIFYVRCSVNCRIHLFRCAHANMGVSELHWHHILVWFCVGLCASKC